MKKTTYILLGLIASFFILIVASGIIIKLSSNKLRKQNELEIGDKRITNRYDNISAIKVINNENIAYNFGCPVIISLSESDTTAITMPDYKYFNSYQKEDTLFVELIIEKSKTKHSFRAEDTKNIKIEVKAPEKLNYIYSGRGYNSIIDTMRGDSITLDMDMGNILMYGSNYRAVNLSGKYSFFTAQNSTIDSLHVDLDDCNTWRIDSCSIDTEFISGSGYGDYYHNEKECKRIVWTPKSDNARFMIDKKAIITPIE